MHLQRRYIPNQDAPNAKTIPPGKPRTSDSRSKVSKSQYPSNSKQQTNESDLENLNTNPHLSNRSLQPTPSVKHTPDTASAPRGCRPSTRSRQASRRHRSSSPRLLLAGARTRRRPWHRRLRRPARHHSLRSWTEWRRRGGGTARRPRKRTARASSRRKRARGGSRSCGESAGLRVACVRVCVVSGRSGR